MRLGRLQIFNNWSPDLVPDPSKAWLGLEYFCTEGDDLWTLADDAMRELAMRELAQIGLVDRRPTCSTASSSAFRRRIRPISATYAAVRRVRAYARPHREPVPGRPQRHAPYNNQDHSMLTAMAAVDNIVAGRVDKANLWAINVDDDYLEEK